MSDLEHPDEAPAGSPRAPRDGGPHPERQFELTRRPERDSHGDLHGTGGNTPDPFLLLADGTVIGGTYWCRYNPAASGFGRDDGGLDGESWASWGPGGLSCGHPDREAAERVQAAAYRADPDGWDARLAARERPAPVPERARADGTGYWDHRSGRDFWAGYHATLARVRDERPATLGAVVKILNDFQAPSAGDAFFGHNADDVLSGALRDAGWGLEVVESYYLWQARHPVTGEELHCVEGDIYPGLFRPSALLTPSRPRPQRAAGTAAKSAPPGDRRGRPPGR